MRRLLRTYIVALHTAAVAMVLSFTPANAGCIIGGGIICAPPPTYQGPGDVVSGATVFGSCARVFTAAQASTATSLCDLVDSAAPTTVICTLRGPPTGFVDLTGTTIAIAKGDAACPAKALRAWLHASGIEAGPIFRPIDKAGTVRPTRLTDRSVANIVKAYAQRAGFDASTFSGHSLRAGFLTSAAGNGASIFKMMDVSRHKSVDTLRGYVRDAELFKDHAGAGLL